MLKTVSKFIQLFFLLFLGTGAMQVHGQVFPVQVTTQVIPPYTPYLSDYTAPGSQRMMVNFILRDPTLPEYRCKLRITIEGVGITIRTKASYVPEALVLPGGGVPTLLTGEDLTEYFKPDNLDFAGVTRAQYEKGAKLPEGVYRFTVEVLDYNRNTVVSNKGTATAWVILNDPPLLNLPRKDTKVQILDPTNIPFTWTPRHTGSPNAAFSTEYIFRLVEIWPVTRNPYDAFLSQPALYEVTTNVPQIIYDMAAPALLPGRKYAWQVQARDVEGRDLFKNEGRSEVYVFQFGDALGIPQTLTLQSSTSSALTVRWDQPAAGADAVTYRTRYRPHNNRTHDDWYEGTTNDQWKTISSLQPKTEYEVQVRAEQTMQTSDYSPTAVFKTAEAGASDFACKSDVQPPPAPASTTPTFPMGINDTIHAGGYDVLVRSLTASGKTYTGEGFAIVPWLHGAKIRVTFKDIAVNSQFWLTSGDIKSVWNADSKFLINVPTKDNPANTPNTGDLPVTVVATDSTVTIKDGAIATVTKDPDGNIVVSTTDGKTTVLEKGKSYSIVDGVGNGYVVDKEGNITKTTADQALAAADRGNRDYNIAMRFEKPSNGKFGFDAKKYEALNSFYQQLNEGDYIAWKAVTSSESDQVNAVITGDLKQNKLKFEIGDVSVTPANTSGSTITLNVQGKAEGTVEELLATYPTAKDSTKTEFVGKLNLVSYDKISQNLVIVSVNGVQLPGGVTEASIQAGLNGIYKQSVVEWKVSTATPLKAGIPADVFDDGESGLLSNYTGDMKTVINAYPGKFQDNTYYLFLVNHPKSGALAKGYMPRNKQAGFIFVSNHSGADIINTIAHELGHGAFNLQHTFDEFPALVKGTTDNLMDYSDGSVARTAMYKYQWDHVHNPQSVISLFEDDDDSKSIGFQLSQLTDDYKNEGAYTFFAPSGKIITLPSDADYVAMATVDPLYYMATGELSGNAGPVGSLWWFRLGGKIYKMLNISGTGVTYYCSESKEYYKDILSDKLKIDKVLVGLPFYDNGLGFDVYKVALTEGMKNGAPTEQFGVLNQDLFTIVDALYGGFGGGVIDDIATGKLNGYTGLFQTQSPEATKSIKFEEYSGFSQLGLAYLESNARYCKKGSPLAPIIISNAYWISFMKGSETSSLCELATLPDPIRRLDRYFSDLDEMLITEEVVMTPQGASMLKHQEATMLYYDYRTHIGGMKFDVVQLKNANTSIAAYTNKDGDALLKLLKELTPCDLENLTFDNRMKAINILEVMSGEDAETEIVRLIASTTYNAQAKQLVDRVFKDNSKLYFKLYDRLDFSDFHLYLNKLSEIMRSDNETNAFSDDVVLSSIEGDHRNCTFTYSFNEAAGTVKFTKFYYVGASRTGATATLYSTREYKLTEFLRVKFPKENACMDLYEDKYNNDDTLYIPAFHLAYLIKKKQDDATFKCVRVLGNTLAILLAIPSGGQSLTIAGGISIVLASGDIVMTMVEDDLRKSETGAVIVKAWDLVQWADMGVAAAQIGKIAVTKLANGAVKLAISVPDLVKLAVKGELHPIIVQSIRTTTFKLLLMQQSAFSALMNTKLLKQIDFANIQYMFNKFKGVRSDAALVTENWVECSVDIAGSRSKLFELGGTATEAYVKGEVKAVKDVTDEVVGGFEDLKFLDEASSSIKSQKVKIRYNAASKTAYLSPWSLLTHDAATGKILFNSVEVGTVKSGTLTLKEGVSAVGATVDDVVELTGVTKIIEDGVELEAKSVKITSKNGRWICEAEGGYCFVAGTPVVTRQGVISIEKLKEGDEVTAFNVGGKRNVSSRISKVFRSTVTRLAKLVIGGALIISTPEHPFYSHGQYIPAKDLQVGDSIYSSTGSVKVVSSINLVDTTAVVYNLEVERYHNYFVGRGGLLVHNSCALKTIYSQLTDAQRGAFKTQLRAVTEASSAERTAFINRMAGLSADDFAKIAADFSAGGKDFALIFVKNERAIDAYLALTRSFPDYAKSAKDLSDLVKDMGRYGDDFADLVTHDGDALAFWDAVRSDVNVAADALREMSVGNQALFTKLVKYEKFVQNVVPLFTKGKGFESVVRGLLGVDNSALYSRIKQVLGDDFNIAEYEAFGQVYIETGYKVDKLGNVYHPSAIPTGVNAADLRPDYFIADFLLIRKSEEFGQTVLHYDDVIVLESKLNQSTPLTGPQRRGLNQATAGVTMPNKSATPRMSFERRPDINAQPGMQPTIPISTPDFKVKKWLKIWSDGQGTAFNNLEILL